MFTTRGIIAYTAESNKDLLWRGIHLYVYAGIRQHPSTFLARLPESIWAFKRFQTYHSNSVGINIQPFIFLKMFLSITNCSITKHLLVLPLLRKRILVLPFLARAPRHCLSRKILQTVLILFCATGNRARKYWLYENLLDILRSAYQKMKTVVKLIREIERKTYKVSMKLGKDGLRDLSRTRNFSLAEGLWSFFFIKMT